MGTCKDGKTQITKEGNDIHPPDRNTGDRNRLTWKNEITQEMTRDGLRDRKLEESDDLISYYGMLHFFGNPPPPRLPRA